MNAAPAGVYVFDTNALFKRYQDELGSDYVRAVFATPGTVCVISELAILEFHATLGRLVRAGDMQLASYKPIVAQLGNDVLSSSVQVEVVTGGIMAKAVLLLDKYGPRRALSAPDALHLATMLAMRTRSLDPRLLTSDATFAAIAKAEKIVVIDPETRSAK